MMSRSENHSNESLPGGPPKKVGPLGGAWRGGPGKILRPVLALLPLVWIARKLDLAVILDSITAVGPLSWAGVMSALLAAYLVGAVRWRVLIGAYGGMKVPGILTLTRYVFVGMYYAILPSGMAGEVVRGFRVRECFDKVSTSYTVVFLERICGLVALIILSVVAIPFIPTEVDSEILLGIEVAAGVATLAALVILFLPYMMKRDAGAFRFLRRLPVVGKILNLIPPARSARGLLLALILSLSTQFLTILSTYFIATQVIEGVSLLTCLRVIPLIMLFSSLPVTPIGLGQREFFSIYFFGTVGVGAEQAVAVSLLIFTSILAIMLIGGVFHLYERITGIESKPK